MDPETIKKSLKKAGKDMAYISRQVGVSRSAVHQVVHNRRKSYRIRSAIAVALGCEINQIWIK